MSTDAPLDNRPVGPRRPPDRSVTQRDVARAAGVHRATVSRALDPRRRELLDPATVRKISDVAAALGYYVKNKVPGASLARIRKRAHDQLTSLFVA